MSIFDIRFLTVPAVLAVIGVAAIIYARHEWLKIVGS